MRQRAWIWLGTAMALALLEQFVVRGLLVWDTVQYARKKA
jgi:hypothetical protein